MSEKNFNPLQQQAIAANGGHFLVLAAPGCGKTDILAERIAYAHEQGVAFSDMLCLTFTNRAARGMLNRVRNRIGEDSRDVFVGNIHRLCSHLLFDNELVPANTSIIDEDDQTDILIAWDENVFRHPHTQQPLRDKINTVTTLACYIWQRAHKHPEEACVAVKDAEHCFETAKSHNYDFNRIPEDNDHNRLTRFALQYLIYKKEHNLFDFNDILARAYDLMIHPDNDRPIRRYPWIQVDEVQDLNPLQMAIIDAITLHNGQTTVMYLGDEQQAIFSFIGAKLENLDKLRQRCDGNIIHLGVNYRSAKYLLDVFNTYARDTLKVDPALLPSANNDQVNHDKFDLLVARSNSYPDEMRRIPAMIRHYMQFDGERLALLVSTNKTADDISQQLTNEKIIHFKISGSDLFQSIHYRMLASVFALAANEYNESAWTRLFVGLGITKKIYDARKIIKSLQDNMMTPFDLLSSQTLLEHFIEIYESREIVVFDTETTGLDTSVDEIVQIAAFKMFRGKKVHGSDFNIFLHTERPIPPTLGNKPNPIVDEYPKHPHVPPEQALSKFLEYIGDCPVLGHNVVYDLQILKANCEHFISETPVISDVLDTLILTKRVNPTLRRYKLEYLLKAFHLEGANSHLAHDDIAATGSLVNYLYAQAKPIVEGNQNIGNSSSAASKAKGHQSIRNSARAASIINQMQAVKPFFDNLQDVLNQPIAVTGFTLASAFNELYTNMRAQGMCNDLGEKFNYFLSYIESEWKPTGQLDTLANQITLHINDFTTTIKEADLVNSDNLVNERVFVMTVHKAKGLEFENVVILDAVDGKYPFYNTGKLLRSGNQEDRKKGLEALIEEQRKFYVGITRARKRICVSYSEMNEKGYACQLTPFMESILPAFNCI